MKKYQPLTKEKVNSIFGAGMKNALENKVIVGEDVFAGVEEKQIIDKEDTPATLAVKKVILNFFKDRKSGKSLVGSHGEFNIFISEIVNAVTDNLRFNELGSGRNIPKLVKGVLNMSWLSRNSGQMAQILEEINRADSLPLYVELGINGHIIHKWSVTTNIKKYYMHKIERGTEITEGVRSQIKKLLSSIINHSTSRVTYGEVAFTVDVTKGAFHELFIKGYRETSTGRFKLTDQTT